MKNIGGSILPSSSPEILRAIDFDGGILWPGMLQVFPDADKDTHHLMLVSGNDKTILASHPNGFSCHELAKRIANQDRQAASYQALYIVACGGSVSAACASIILRVTPNLKK